MKKGFVFMETLIVLVVLLITVVGMYGIYVRLSTNIESRKYYDNISDLYITNTIRDLINKDLLSTTESFIAINEDNCVTYMNDTCNNILTTLNVEEIIINFETIDLLISSENNLSNSTKEYLRTINSLNYERNIIVKFKKDTKYYYASLRI